jgi:branched-chain amino acid transport system permease protein
MTTFLNYLIDAVSLGSIDALIALGISVVFGLMGLINFAHGDLITLGAYALFVILAGLALPLPVGLAFLVIVVVAVALLMERVAFRPVRGADGTTLLVTSFALSYTIQNAEVLTFGARPKSVLLPPVFSHYISVGGLQIQNLNVMVIVVTVALLVCLRLFLNRTALGLQMSAAATDFPMARLLGVRANQVIAVAFAISGLLAGVVSFTLVVETGALSPTMGVLPVLIGFAGVIVGGMGSLTGATLGGFVLGFLAIALQALLPTSMGPFRDAFLFALVIIFLLFRPQGLLPGRFNVERV